MVLLTYPERPRPDQDDPTRNIRVADNEVALPNCVYAAVYNNNTNNGTVAVRPNSAYSGHDTLSVRPLSGPDIVSMRPGSVVHGNGGPENGSVRANSVASSQQRPKGLYIPNEQLRSRCIRYLSQQQTPGVSSTASTTSASTCTKRKG